MNCKYCHKEIVEDVVSGTGYTHAGHLPLCATWAEPEEEEP